MRRGRTTSSVRTGYLMVLTGALLFIVNAGVSRVALRAGVEPTLLTTIRVTGTAMVLVVIAAVFRRPALRLPRGRYLLLVLAHGLVGVAGLQWTYFVAIDRLPIGMALLLEYTAPVLVALWARFVQREQVRNRMWAALALSLVGLTLAAQVWKGATFDSAGIAAGFGAALCFSVYFLLGEHGVNRMDPMQVVVWAFIVASVGLNVVEPVTSFPHGLLGSSTSLLGGLGGGHAPVWLLLGWIVVLGTVIPFAAELFALRLIPATTVTTVAMLEPVGTTILGWVWFRESLTPLQSIGAVGVVVGIVLAQTSRLGRPADATVVPPVP
jgi:drug/metabolite transporter (DMT)-like permease